MISTLPGSQEFWNVARIDLVLSQEPSSDAISFQFLNVCDLSEASCSAKKRSPLSVQRRIVTAGPVADGKRRDLRVGKRSPFAQGDDALPDTVTGPTSPQLQPRANLPPINGEIQAAAER